LPERHVVGKRVGDHEGMNTRPILCAAAVAAAALLGGCAVYPAYPAYQGYGIGQVVAANPGVPVQGPTVVQQGPVYMAPAPVYVAPAPVYYGGPIFYPSISIFGRFGGGHHRRR
jgi:hypothetical protein